jgi:uncharacterized RDD family membrane protein YckC
MEAAGNQIYGIGTMNWYYVDAGGQQVGPVDEAQFAGLVGNGGILPDTLVWQEGMTEWQAYKTLVPPAPLPTAQPGGGLRIRRNEPANPPIQVPAGTTSPTGQAACGVCGKMFDRDFMIRHGEHWICATCKPAFLQRLREGVHQGGVGVLRYAGFWIRFAAVFVDGLLLWVVNMAISMIGVLFIGGAASVAARGSDQAAAMGFIILQLVLFFIQIAIALSYETIMIGRYGATLGKMACGIRVVNATGEPITYARALGRYFAKILSGLTLLIGYLMAAFDDERRTLHDRICDTRVVHK